MARSDFQLYDDEFYGGFVETVYQQVEAFNGASAGGFQLLTDFHEGLYQKEAFFDIISGLIARRDSDSTSAVADLSMTTDEFVGVKLDRRIGPVAQTLDAWRKINQDPRRMSFVIGQQTARAIPQEILNRGLAAAEAKLDSVAALEETSANDTITTADLVNALANFGDAADQIVCWVMHSKVYFDLVKSQISAAIYRANGTQIVQGTPATMNRPVIITDSASLVQSQGFSSAGDAYSTLGLARGGIIAKFSQPTDAVLDMVTGLQNLTYRFQSEYSYTLSLRGCEWDVGNGGANPADADVATATYWDTQVADVKGLPGVIIKSL